MKILVYLNINLVIDMMESNISFVCIGAQKSGTTWLHNRFEELSEFNMPYVKELHYFDRDESYPSPGKLTVEHIRNRLRSKQWIGQSIKQLPFPYSPKSFKRFSWMLKWLYSNYTEQWYLSLFKRLKGITGEITPAYSIIRSEHVSDMRRILPDNVKLIFLMRNPIERAWSHYRYRVRHTKKDFSKLEDGEISEIKDFIESENQSLRSDFVRTLKVYREHFQDDQIIVGFYDAIITQPDLLLKDIVEFVGGDKERVDMECNLKQKNNVSPQMDIPEGDRSFSQKQVS